MKDNNCFQYAVIVTVKHKEIGKDPQNATKNKRFTNRCNWKKLIFHQKKKIEKNLIKLM